MKRPESETHCQEVQGFHTDTICVDGHRIVVDHEFAEQDTPLARSEYLIIIYFENKAKDGYIFYEGTEDKPASHAWLAGNARESSLVPKGYKVKGGEVYQKRFGAWEYVRESRRYGPTEDRVNDAFLDYLNDHLLEEEDW